MSCLFVTTVYPVLLIIDFAYYDYEISKGVADPSPTIPWWITMFFDLGWFSFLGTTSIFMPPAPHLKVKYSLVTDEELKDLHTKAVGNWKKTRLSLAAIRKRRDEERAERRSNGVEMEIVDVVENGIVESRGVETTM